MFHSMGFGFIIMKQKSFSNGMRGLMHKSTHSFGEKEEVGQGARRELLNKKLELLPNKGE